MSASRTSTTWLIMSALSSAFAILLAVSPVGAKSPSTTQASPTGGKVTSGGRGITNYNWRTPTQPTTKAVTKQTSQPTSSSSQTTPKVVKKPTYCTKKTVTKKPSKTTQPRTTQVQPQPKATPTNSSEPFNMDQFLKDKISKPIHDTFTPPWMR